MALLKTIIILTIFVFIDFVCAMRGHIHDLGYGTRKPVIDASKERRNSASDRSHPPSHPWITPPRGRASPKRPRPNASREMGIELDSKDREIIAKNAEIEAMNQVIIAKNRDIEIMEKDIIVKNREIEQLTANLTSLQQEINSYRSRSLERSITFSADNDFLDAQEHPDESNDFPTIPSRLNANDDNSSKIIWDNWIWYSIIAASVVITMLFMCGLFRIFYWYQKQKWEAEKIANIMSVKQDCRKTSTSTAGNQQPTPVLSNNSNKLRESKNNGKSRESKNKSHSVNKLNMELSLAIEENTKRRQKLKSWKDPDPTENDH